MEGRDVLVRGIPRLEIAREVQKSDGGPPAETVGGLREVMRLDIFGERHAVVGVDDGAVDLDRAIEGGGGTMLATRALKPLSGASPATAWPVLPLAPVMVTLFLMTVRPWVCQSPSERSGDVVVVGCLAMRLPGAGVTAALSARNPRCVRIHRGYVYLVGVVLATRIRCVRPEAAAGPTGRATGTTLRSTSGVMVC